MYLLLAALLSVASPGGAHPGHGSTVVMGTLLSVSPASVSIEVRDLATVSTRTVVVLVDADTRYRVGKEPVTTPASYIGTRVVAVVDFEEGPTGDIVYRATELRLTKAKTRP